MKQEYDNELTTEQREKMKRNLVYLGCFSVVMLFAGLTSGYLVSMGDSFWVKYDFPKPFYISTALIIISSFVLETGIRRGRKGHLRFAQAFVALAFVLGLGFAWFQVKGYGALVDSGAHFNSNVIVTEGRYGDYYELKVNGKYLEVNANDYMIGGKVISESQKNDISAFAKQFLGVDTLVPKTIHDYGKYTLTYKNEDVRFVNGKLIAGDSTELLFTDLRRLRDFSRHLADKRGDFFVKGTLGKDFHIYFKGKELQYKNRSLYFDNRKFDGPMQLKINQAADTATSYLYIITALHFLHVIGALIYLLRMSIRSFTGRIQTNDYISVRMGAIFWHFLGALWIYLLLFLLFIH
jgi:cytochrome c oxidase subunit III